MKPINIGGHAAYQNRVLEQLRKYYPDAAHSLLAFWSGILPELARFTIFSPVSGFPMRTISCPKPVSKRKHQKTEKEGEKAPSAAFPHIQGLKSNRDGLVSLKDLSIVGEGTPVYTVAQERKKRT